MSDKESREYTDKSNSPPNEKDVRRGSTVEYEALQERRKSVAMNIVENPLQVCFGSPLQQDKTLTFFCTTACYS